MNTKTETINCDNCGKVGARVIHVSRSYGKGTGLLVIENVPVISCPHCGESYLTASTLRETLDHRIKTRSSGRSIYLTWRTRLKQMLLTFAVHYLLARV